MSAEGIGAGLLWKFGAAACMGVLGAAMMAAVDPPSDRKTLFRQALTAGVGSILFGPVAVRVLGHYVDFAGLAEATGLRFYEVAIPVYFVVGALSWGIFGAIAKVRDLIAADAADVLADKLHVPRRRSGDEQ